MLSILNPEPVNVETRPPESPAAKAEGVKAQAPKNNPGAPGEFEFVLGRRQIAGVLFVATVIAVVVSAVSYLAGKSLSVNQGALPPLVIAPAALAPRPPAILGSIPGPSLDDAMSKTGSTPAKASPDIVARDSGQPLFAEPVAGAVYIQMGAVEQGIATVFAEGLRKEGFDAFVAPGPNEKIFRVLIGPLPNPAAFQRAKDAVDKLGLSTFARKYEK